MATKTNTSNQKNIKINLNESSFKVSKKKVHAKIILAFNIHFFEIKFQGIYHKL
jgi:hypothetical protein